MLWINKCYLLMRCVYELSNLTHVILSFFLFEEMENALYVECKFSVLLLFLKYGYIVGLYQYDELSLDVGVKLIYTGSASHRQHCYFFKIWLYLIGISIRFTWVILEASISIIMSAIIWDHCNEVKVLI
jgi:hypothetical protein